MHKKNEKVLLPLMTIGLKDPPILMINLSKEKKRISWSEISNNLHFNLSFIDLKLSWNFPYLLNLFKKEFYLKTLL